MLASRSVGLPVCLVLVASTAFGCAERAPATTPATPARTAGSPQGAPKPEPPPEEEEPEEPEEKDVAWPELGWPLEPTECAGANELVQRRRGRRLERWCEDAQGRRQGPFVALHAEHEAPLVEGRFVDGEREGRWVRWSVHYLTHDGETHYRKGQRHGPYRELAGLPTVRGHYRHGERHGRWLFEHGTKVVFSRLEHDEVRFSATYRRGWWDDPDGCPDGTTLEEAKSGATSDVQRTVRCVAGDGTPRGPFAEWHADGSVRAGIALGDETVRATHWRDGETVEQHYEDGELARADTYVRRPGQGRQLTHRVRYEDGTTLEADPALRNAIVDLCNADDPSDPEALRRRLLDLRDDTDDPRFLELLKQLYYTLPGMRSGLLHELAMEAGLSECPLAGRLEPREE
ncbi:MAG: toxin-antitoxin system YwqK family antitoxin [Myxococcota bacterium]